MARTASIAVAGYYPTPPELLAALAALVTPHPDAAHADAWLDPCCGKGEALAGIARKLYPKGGASKHRVALYAVEAEEGRHASAREELRDFAPTTWLGSSLYRGDALRAEVTTDSEHVGVSGLYLNPPYDTDPRCKRLEERFLRHYTPALAPEGVLLFVVPAHALPASADTLATAYRDVAVLRFPDDHYAAFKQVVLIARKRATPLPMPHSVTAALVRTAAESPLDLPVLGTAVRPWKLPTVTGRERFGVELKIRPVSPDALAGLYKPWGVTLRGGTTREALNTHPVSATAGLERRYPAAMPLKPGHLAAALAAGVFNGECVVADDPACGAPPLLVKGVFKREWHTVEEKVTKDGAPAGEVQVEAPRLEVTVLSLTTGELHTLDAVPEPKGSTDPAEMTTGDLLVTYSRTLLAAMRLHCPPDYAPDNAAQHFPLVQSARPLYRAQEHACRGVVTQLGGPGLPTAARRGRYATLIGEVGCLRGDTMIHDPVDGSTRTAADRHRRGEPFHVWALGPHGPVVAAAMPPKRYPPAQMVRVVREDGASIVVTPAHRFWDGRAWVRASDVASLLHEGGRALLASSADTDLSAHAVGGTRWSGTAPSSPGGCPPGPSSCGGPPPPPSEDGPGRPPSPDGARARSPRRSPPGASARTGARTRSYQSSDPHSTPGCESPTADPASAQSPPPHGSRPRLGSGSSRASSRPLQGCPPARRPHGLELVAPASTSSVPSSHTSHDRVEPDLPGSHPAVQAHAVVAVEPLDTAPYYDFHVPVFNNYWAAGLWHHNSGKSGVFLIAARTAGATRVLILCPPHLLTGWEREAAAVWPEARVVVLDSVARIEALAADTGGPVVALLTRETAKLGHGWVGVSVCPACGAKDPRPAEALATKRARCIATIRTPQTPAAARALDYARRLGGHAEFHAARALGFDRRVAQTARGAADAVLRDAALAVRAAADPEAREVAVSFLANAALSAYDPALRLDLAATLAPHSGFAAARLLSTVDPATPGWDAASALITDAHWSEKLTRTVNRAWRDDDRVPSWETFAVHREKGTDGREHLSVSGLLVGSAKHLDDAVLAGTLGALAAPCGEVLYQATASPVGTSPFGGTPGAGPRRYPLATYIARRHPRLFDLLGLDECFVAGTRVAGRPIEDIVVGDAVESFDEETQRVVSRRVTRLWRKAPTALVRITFDDQRSFVCTPNHPVYVGGAWVPAGLLIPGDCATVLANEYDVCGVRGGDAGTPAGTESSADLLQPELLWEARPAPPSSPSVGGVVSVVQGPGVALRGGGYESPDAGARVLRGGVLPTRQECGDRAGQCGRVPSGCRSDFGADEGVESDARPGNGGEGERRAPGPDIPRQGREWDANGPAARVRGGVGVADRSNDPDGSGRGAVSVTPARLQGGYRGRGDEDGGRGGRKDAPAPPVEVPGPTKDGGARSTRVARVEVLECGSDGRYGGVCPDGVVYNLGVEGTHTYFAEGVLVHNCHEYGGDGSAQERAAHRLTATRVPTVQLTGSLVNGYARHLFSGLWGLDVEFRGAFGKDSIGKFSQQYGYRRRFVDAEGKVKESDRGAVTDRVEGGVRDMGEAPGVQPLAVLRFVVRRAATLHKAELDTGVPELVTELVPVDPDPEALAAHKTMLAALVNQVKRDAFTPLSGALWGQLAEAPSHLDRCTADVGNTAEGAWVVQYPPHRGGGVVHRVEGLPAATVLPKEAWMVARCKAEVADGRPVIVLAWHTALFPRLHRLLRAAGLRVSVLDAGKVSAAKRQVWIEAQIAKGVDVLITNPVAIQTGLNCLTHFATTLWMQNPNCNAIVFRQANGRIDRIGQKQAPRCLIPVYRGSTQEALHTLLMRKVAVSQSTDGLDARSALQATGVGEVTAVSTLSVGKLLFDLLDRGEA